MKQRRPRSMLCVRPLALLVAGLFSGTASAAGFALLEQNASGIGSAFAGTAAAAQDASTVFFNPAGMTYVQGKQVVLGLDAVRPSVKFSDRGTAMPAGITARNGNGGDAGDWALIPDAYFVMPIAPNLSLGLGLNAPFGPKTEYDGNWIGRFHAIKSEIKTINVNPSVAWKVNDIVSLGAGLNYQRFQAELSNAVNFSAVIPGLEGRAKVKGDDSSWGYNLGAIFQVSPTTRVGIAYRSAIKFNVSGDVNFDRPVTGVGAADAAIAAATPNGPVKVDIKMPDSLTLSAYRQLTDKWEVLGDLQWTGWSKIPRLEIYRTSGTLLSREELQWRDTYRIALGANYRYTTQWMIRMGIAYDQSPVGDQYRNARLPDNNRTWMSVGAQYKPTPTSAIDFGYAHLWVREPSVNNDGGSLAAKGRLVGNYDSDVNILGVQYSQSF